MWLKSKAGQAACIQAICKHMKTDQGPTFQPPAAVKQVHDLSQQAGRADWRKPLEMQPLSHLPAVIEQPAQSYMLPVLSAARSICCTAA